MASCLVRSSPDRAVRVRTLAGDIVLCSWARYFTLAVPLSTQVYKWVLANLMLGVTLRWTSIPSRAGVEILLVASCYRNWYKLRSDGPLGSYADFTLPGHTSSKFLFNLQIQDEICTVWIYFVDNGITRFWSCSTSLNVFKIKVYKWLCLRHCHQQYQCSNWWEFEIFLRLVL